MPKPSRCSDCRTAVREMKRCECPNETCNMCTWAKRKLAECDCTGLLSDNSRRSAIEIEKDVPIPDSHSNVGTGKWQLLAVKMEPGDSVLVGTKRQAERLRGALKKIGVSSISRAVEDGTRVWRTDDNA